MTAMPRTDAAIKRAAYKVDDDTSGEKTEYDIGKIKEDMDALEQELAQAQAQLAEVRNDAERIDFLEENSYTLQSRNSATGGDDYEVVWDVVGYWMQEPKERIIASGDSPRSAIDAAIAAQDKKDE